MGRGKLRSSLRVLALALGLYVVLRPMLGFGHELVVAALAWLTRGLVQSAAWAPVIQVAGVDPIYTGAALQALGGVTVAGFAVACPVGEALHAWLPTVFCPCDQVAVGAGISMIAGPGTPALGRAVAAFGADVAWLVVGLGLVHMGRRRPLVWLGLLIQAQIAVNHLLDAQVALADIDASGLPRAVQIAFPQSGWFTVGLAAWQPELRDAVTGVVLLGVGYAVAAGLLVLLVGLARLAQRGAAQRPAEASAARRSRLLLGSGILVAVAAACSPIGGLALGESNWQASLAVRPTQLSVTMAPARGRRAAKLVGGTPVKIVPNPSNTDHWSLLVADTPEVIRGVGYNPAPKELGVDARAARYQQDFAQMDQLGINTIEGWFEGQFDSVTLDAAARAHLGVIMPFELNQDWDYGDPTVRASILDGVSAYVRRYRNHPAVRMWAPGNENFHRILFAGWVSREQDPTAQARADAFAAFLPVLVDRIHELDPHHPVLYRDAEDRYIARLRRAFDAAGGERPWLAYGANVYTPGRLQQIVSTWPAPWPGHPLVVSEFAPTGVGAADRPAGYAQQWAIVRSRPDQVLGGLAYVWATDGPEDLDRVFGLVGPDAMPQDGALAALTAAYRNDLTDVLPG